MGVRVPTQPDAEPQLQPEQAQAPTPAPMAQSASTRGYTAAQVPVDSSLPAGTFLGVRQEGLPLPPTATNANWYLEWQRPHEKAINIIEQVAGAWVRRRLTMQSVLVAAAAPVVNSHPASQAVAAGATLSLHAGCKSNSPITAIEWAVDGGLALVDGGDISGATTTNLQVANFEAADEGDYVCTFTNAAGSGASNAATVTVAT